MVIAVSYHKGEVWTIEDHQRELHLVVVSWRESSLTIPNTNIKVTRVRESRQQAELGTVLLFHINTSNTAESSKIHHHHHHHCSQHDDSSLEVFAHFTRFGDWRKSEAQKKCIEKMWGLSKQCLEENAISSWLEYYLYQFSHLTVTR